MAIFKKTKDILTDKWPDDSNFEYKELPRKYDWLKERPITIEDVDLWEQIYLQPGNIGIYAAWSPYQEIYIVVHLQFLEQDHGIEIYQGLDASDKVFERAKKFNIELAQNPVWI